MGRRDGATSTLRLAAGRPPSWCPRRGVRLLIRHHLGGCQSGLVVFRHESLVVAWILRERLPSRIDHRKYSGAVKPLPLPKSKRSLTRRRHLADGRPASVRDDRDRVGEWWTTISRLMDKASQVGAAPPADKAPSFQHGCAGAPAHPRRTPEVGDRCTRRVPAGAGGASWG
jgi:hypothetical protein